MKVTYNWLKEFVAFDAEPEKLVEQLTMLGLEVDSYHPDKKHFDGIVVGKVIDKSPHENADKLSVCRVDVGAEVLTIVCGADNVAAGQIVPVATSGTKLPDGHKIRTSKIRGVESNGMICSESELGLASKSDGILVLGNGYAPGQPFQELVDTNDVIIDIDVTPNRPDCFGAIGIARDLAAFKRTQFRVPRIPIKETQTSVDERIQIQIHDATKCPRYTARYIDQIKVGPSPLWLVQRLEQIGIRSINNVVDITNFVMMETGQPLHAFDYDLLAGAEIHVRCAAEGEQFTTLDGKSHILRNECLLICDKEKPVAVGGIMGGQNSEVSAETTRVLLESAYFDAVNIRRSSKQLGQSTESSKRFERGVDPNGCHLALDRAAQLLADLAGGQIAQGRVDVYPQKIEPKTVELRPARVASLLGVQVESQEIKTILQHLGFGVVDSDGSFLITVPTFRPDVEREADLIEEVGRVYGYDNIPADFSSLVHHLDQGDDEDATIDRFKRFLVAMGFSEVVTFNLMSESQASVFSTGDGVVRLINPLSEDLATLRPSLLPQLLKTLKWNINRQNKNLKLFEHGTTFCSVNGKIQERNCLTGVLTGLAATSSWKAKVDAVDFFDAKGAIEQLLNRNGLAGWRFEKASAKFAGQDMLKIVVDDVEIGCLGEIAGEVAGSAGVEQPVFFFDLELNALLEHRSGRRVFRPISKFPPVGRDLAIVVENRLAANELFETVKKEGGKLLKHVQIFDIFRSEQIGPDKKSIALGLTFHALDRTLTEDEVDGRMSRILAKLGSEHAAQLRS